MQTKQIFSLLFLSLSACALHAQTPDEAPPPLSPAGAQTDSLPAPVAEEPYFFFDVQKTPAFPGGDAEMLKYLSTHIIYPEQAIKNNIEGMVVLDFIVEKDGSISEISIRRDIGGGCGQEAARVVALMPRWTPGEAKGHPVRVRFTLPVRFKFT